MKCNKCGNEIPIESEFCSYCGNKVEKEEKKTIKLSLKQVIIIEIIVILGIAIVAGICISIWTKPQIGTSNITQNNNATSKIKTYELNKIGYYKNENILEEKYNNNLDLIYCKYNSGNEIKEDTYNYEYDNKGRTIKVSLNNNDSTLEIEYAGEEISKITTNYSLLKKEYQIMEDMDENKFISEYSTLNQQIGNESKGQITYDGKYLFFSENINNEKYNIVIKYDKNNKLESYKIYKEGDEKYNSLLNQLGFIPLCYVGDITNSNTKSNYIIGYIGFNIYYPIINQGNEIYTNNQGSISKKIYDSKGRILYNENQGNSNNKWFYKYNDIDSKTYEIECLVDGIDENNYRALGMKSQYVIEKIKCYLDDENKIYKYEMYEDEEINQTEALKLEKEYLEYINNNKVDSDNIISVLSKYLNIVEEETQQKNQNVSTQQNKVNNQIVYLKDVAKEGDYVDYKVPNKDFVWNKDLTGYEETQVFNTQNYKGTWQVLYNTDNGLEIVSSKKVGDLILKGEAGYYFLRNDLDAYAYNYEDNDFCRKSRAIGMKLHEYENYIDFSSWNVKNKNNEIVDFNDMSVMLNSKFLDKDEDYREDKETLRKLGIDSEDCWFASRNVQYTDRLILGANIQSNNKNMETLCEIEFYKENIHGWRYKLTEYAVKKGVRVVLTLNDNIKVIGGKGTKENPYVIQI